MARPKEFNRENVLQRAMEVFWARGYEATSVQDLVAHMGINRQSIYDTFGDKHTLYLQALDRYRQVETRRLAELLEHSPSVKRAMRQLFCGVVEGSLRGDRRGCFMGNAMSELGGRCKKTAVRTGSNMTAMEEAFYRALVRGKRQGELKQVRDVRAVARFLCSSFQGLLLMSKVTHDRERLEDVVEVTLSVVN